MKRKEKKLDGMTWAKLNALYDAVMKDAGENQPVWMIVPKGKARQVKRALKKIATLRVGTRRRLTVGDERW